MTWLAPRDPTQWGRRLSSAAVGGVPQGPHAVGTAPLLRRRGGRVVAYGHNTRILSRPKSEACLDEIRSGGASPPDSASAHTGSFWDRPSSRTRAASISDSTAGRRRPPGGGSRDP